MISQRAKPPATRISPIVCAGARRRSVGLPGLRIWKPSSRLLVQRHVGVAEHHDVGALAEAAPHALAAGRRAGRRRGPSRCGRPRPPPRAPRAAAGAARRCPRCRARPPPAGRSPRARAAPRAVEKSPAWRSRSAAAIRSTHASGSRRAPRGRCVSEITAISMRGLHWIFPAPVAQWIERCPPEAEVEGSNPPGRVTLNPPRGILGEHVGEREQPALDPPAGVRRPPDRPELLAEDAEWVNPHDAIEPGTRRGAVAAMSQGVELVPAGYDLLRLMGSARRAPSRSVG